MSIQHWFNDRLIEIIVTGYVIGWGTQNKMYQLSS